MYKKAFKFKLYPTAEQKIELDNKFSQARFVYNLFLSMKKDLMKAYKITITRGDIDLDMRDFENFFTYENMANYLQKNTKNKYTWLNESNAQVLQQKLKDLDKAFSKMYKEHAGFPRFKSKKNNRQSMRFPTPKHCKISDNTIKLPKMKTEIKFGKKKQNQRMFGDVKNITISKDTDGNHYISFQRELSLEEIFKSFNKEKKAKMKMKPNKKTIGIDLGIKTQIVTSDGDFFEPKRPTKKYQNKLKKINRQHSKKQNKSKNKEKSRLILAKIHKKIANIRKDSIHKMTTKLIRDNQTIVMEDLNTKGMIKNRKLSKALADVSFGEIRRQLEYKAKWYQRELVFVDRFFPSTQLCSMCQYRNRELTLNDREWVCPSCGIKHNRDKNAANSIRYEGLRLIG